MKLDLSVDEALSTTRTVRKRLDFSRPVPRQVLEECLDLALQAPNGSNRNDWRWIIVDDPALIAKLAEEYRTGVNFYQARASLADPVPRGDQMMESVRVLIDRLHEVPAMLIPLAPGRCEDKDASQQAAMWGSILPAVWSFFLALRERGLGAAWTTVTLVREREVAELLGVPYEDYTQAGLFPVAYTVGTEFKRAWRRPVSEILTYNGF